MRRALLYPTLVTTALLLGCAQLSPTTNQSTQASYQLAYVPHATATPEVRHVDPKHTIPAVLGAKVADYAITLKQKVQYRWGGKTLKSGLDCSGLVTHAYNTVLGLQVTGNAASMFRSGTKVKKPDLVPGDLVFFNTMNRPNSHIGIYLGEGKFVHALNKKTGVRIDTLSDSYYAKRYEGARRVL